MTLTTISKNLPHSLHRSFIQSVKVADLLEKQPDPIYRLETKEEIRSKWQRSPVFPNEQMVSIWKFGPLTAREMLEQLLCIKDM